MTSRWSGGIDFQDEYALRLPMDLAPGQYTLVAGLYDPVSGERLGVRDKNNVEQPDRACVLDRIEVR